MIEMKTSMAPNSSVGRAQRQNPSLSNSKESREISMVVIREPGCRGARAETPDRRNTKVHILNCILNLIGSQCNDFIRGIERLK